MRRYHPIWYGVGFSIAPLMVLFLGYANVHPELYRSIPTSFGSSNSSNYSGIAWEEDDKADPPLEYISDSFKGIRITTETPKIASFWDLWNKPRSEVEYEWQYKVKNLTDKKLRISVTYELSGTMDEIIATSDSFEIAEPGETIEIRHTDSLNYYEARQVTGSGWRIGRREVP